MNTTLLTVALLLAAHLAGAQALRNPSFEGRQGPSVVPPEWEPCGQGSTPDTQPGCWRVSTEPAAGQTYMSLICRGAHVPFPNKWEIVQQHLDEPLRRDVCYKYTIDLARSPTFGAGAALFIGEASLRIWGGSEACVQHELLWESGSIVHTYWRRYDVMLWPARGSYDYLFLEAYYVSEPTYSGNILLDNFLFYPGEIPCLLQASR
ncbi:MAG: hypothetical protein OHK0039_43040 [Bacteroidia bacterium]